MSFEKILTWVKKTLDFHCYYFFRCTVADYTYSF